eukprot:COSAG01_NODE_6441_length_3663_cov_2.253367_1_plen_91_part_00
MTIIMFRRSYWRMAASKSDSLYPQPHDHHHHYHDDDDDDDDIVGLLVHIGLGAEEAGEVARRLTQELGVPSVAHLSELEVRLNDAPCAIY